MKRSIYIVCTLLAAFVFSCDTIKRIPTNTSGGIFSLNGNWQLSSSSDNRAMEGTVVTVVPGVADAAVKSMSNNNYCVREMDVVWRNMKPVQGGGFTLETLVNACNENKVYNAGTITVLSNDEIRLTSRTATGAELLQTWRRVPQ